MRKLQFKGAMQRFRESEHTHQPWWAFRWCFVLTMAAFAIWLRYF